MVRHEALSPAAVLRGGQPRALRLHGEPDLAAGDFGAHFFLTIPTLPYKMVVQSPRECIYTLGYYRAGSRVAAPLAPPPWDPTAATVEGLVVTGLVFLIP